MHTENTPNVLTVGTRLFAETRRDARVMLRQLRRFNPLFHVHGRDRLFRCCDQVIRLTLFIALNLIQVFGEIGELASCLHDRLLDEKWWLDGGIAFLDELLNSEINESLVK